MRIELPLDINPDILIFSLPWTQGWTEQHADKKQTKLLAYTTPHLSDTPIYCMQHCSFYVRFFIFYFFDDRQRQSRAELRGSLLSSGCSIWCAFDVVQAHRRAPSLSVGPWHQTQTGLKSGGEEGRKHTSKTDNYKRKTTATHHSVSAYTLWHSSRVLPSCFRWEEEKQNKDKMEIIMMP